MRGKPRFERCGTRGFTLLEMLVTLVVVSMIVAVMSQALAQLALILVKRRFEPAGTDAAAGQPLWRQALHLS